MNTDTTGPIRFCNVKQMPNAKPFTGRCHYAVKNNSARLITLNMIDEDSGDPWAFMVIPSAGPQCIPAELADTRFCKALVDSGDLSLHAYSA